MDITLILVIISAALLGTGTYLFVSKQQERSEIGSSQNLNERIAVLQEGFVDQGGLESRGTGKNFTDYGNDFANFIAPFAPIPSQQQLSQLNKAGLRQPGAFINIWLQKMSGIVFGVGLGLVVGFMIGMLYGLIVALLLGVLGFMAPISDIRKRTEDRTLKIDKTISDMIDLFANCCVAGVSFDIAAGYILNDLENDPLMQPIKEDFLAWQSDVNLGVERPTAWKNLAERSNSKSMRDFTALMNQSEKTGGSVSESLFKMSSFFRERRKQLLEAEIAQLPSKMSGLTILFIVMPTVVLILGPVGVFTFKTMGEVFGG